MATNYKHTQPGYLAAGALGAGALYALARIASGNSKWKYMPFAAMLGGASFVFSSLTIEVKDGKLRSYFGAGLPARSEDLSEIASVEVVKNPWYYGWGIKYTPHGWLYNVSGLGAVEIRLQDGGQFRLGTDEPTRLRDTIRKALNRV